MGFMTGDAIGTTEIRPRVALPISGPMVPFITFELPRSQIWDDDFGETSME